MANKKSIILKFDYANEQTVGDITKIVGLVKAKFIIPIIDNLDLEANPRSSKTGPVTEAIQESIEDSPELFPFKTKGILLASSQVELLDRKRYKITPDNYRIEGVLDGGHNTLAIGLHILKQSMMFAGMPFPKGAKTWAQFKELWDDNHSAIDAYIEAMRVNPELVDFNFYVPVEMLVPRNTADFACVENFKNELIEICAARNNNVQLQISDKANQIGYFDSLKAMIERRNPQLANAIEWKTNDGGSIKVQDITALAWIPLMLIDSIKDEEGKTVEPIAPNKLYSAKGSCLKQFERLMSSPDVTVVTSADYKRELKNVTVGSAFEITAELPELVDYIYAQFPNAYNAAGGKYGAITAVKTLNEKRKEKVSPYMGNEIETLSPDGFIMPLVYGLQALMKMDDSGSHTKIKWIQAPLPFLINNFGKIVANYCGMISICDYDPQKVGKAAQSYAQALQSFKLAIAGLL